MTEQIEQTEVVVAPAFTLEEVISKVGPETIFLVIEVEGEQGGDELVVLASPVLDRISGTAVKVHSGQAIFNDGKLALLDPKQNKLMLAADLVITLGEDGLTVTRLKTDHAEIKSGFILG